MWEILRRTRRRRRDFLASQITFDLLGGEKDFSAESEVSNLALGSPYLYTLLRLT